MTRLILILIFFTAVHAVAQTSKIKVKKEKEKPVKPVVYHHYTVDLYYGNRVMHKNYYNQLNTITKFNYQAPLVIAGGGFSGYRLHINRNGRVLSQMNYYKIIPSNISIEDSLSTKLSGFVFGMGFGASLSTRKQNLSLAAYIGFNTGRTTLTRNEYISQKNPFFSPKITVQPKLIIKRISLSLLLEAEYDVSNPAWRPTRYNKKPDHLLAPFHQTCYTAVVSLGYKPY